MLALKNFKRNRGRYRSIVLSLILSVVLFISVHAFVLDPGQASEMAVAFTTYDIALDTRSMDDADMLPLFDRLKELKSLSENSYQEVRTYSCMVAGSDLSEKCYQKMAVTSPQQEIRLSMRLYFLDDDTYARLLEEAGLPAEEYT